MDWINEKILGDDDYGFVYIITNKITNKIYIGKKALYHTRKTKISKREKTKTKTRKTFKYIIKDSGWKSYWGSSEELLKDYKKNPNHFKKEIIDTAINKKQLSYLEAKYQFQYNVLEENTYNKNILGKYYKKDTKI